MKVTSYGHACFSVEVGEKTLLFDPFITPNPLAASIDISLLKPDYILLSHGHSDHVADTEVIAKQSGAMLIANYEVVLWFQAKGIENLHGMNTGGSWTFDFGRVTYTAAIHSSCMPDGSYGGQPGGFLVETSEGAFYYSGDTALTQDMKLIPTKLKSEKLKFAALCLGGNFTMDAEDAATTAEWIGCDEIFGVHYDTFPLIVIEPEAAKAAFATKGKNLHLLPVGGTMEF